MEKDYNQDSFEEFLQTQLKNHRMYPKDSVWREINATLHGEKRWPALTIAAILLISVTTVICFYFSSKQNIFSSKLALAPLQSQGLSPVANNPKTDIISAFTKKEESGVPQTAFLKKDDSKIFTKDIEIKPVNNKELKQVSVSKNDVKKSESYQAIVSRKAEGGNKNTIVYSQKVADESTENVQFQNNTELGINLNKKTIAENIPVIVTNKQLSVVKNISKQADLNENREEKNPSLIETFKAAHKPGKLSILFYLAPSVSYRKLTEEQIVSKSSNNGPVSLNQVTDVNNVVRHKPSSGAEGGLNILYDLTKFIRVKTGLQFNVRQYTIDAYRANTEISSIALIDGNRVDTINTLTYYRNYNGNSSTELLNRYYQISIPIGLEMQVWSHKKFQFNLAANLQPTLLLNRNAYLLTTNFKNYTEKDEMVRKWNLNSNFEAFISMNTGDFKWQIGPQIRYQVNSTFIMQYPIKEHLIDYGIKLGVSTRLK